MSRLCDVTMRFKVKMPRKSLVGQHFRGFDAADWT